MLRKRNTTLSSLSKKKLQWDKNVKKGAKMTDVVTNILKDVSIYVCFFVIIALTMVVHDFTVSER